MAKYVFPAIFEPDEELGGYCVFFPDLESAFTQGNDFQDAMAMAEDVLCYVLYDMEKDGQAIPRPSKASDIKTEEGNIVNLVACDTEFYVKFFANKSVKLNVTIPLWLKEAGEKKQANFSQILQNGVKEYLQMHS
ncbi:MAG: type II toxin-antitoxin system HicB family antitoxin [Oscillospiraceae bacterium]|nr:type II toxin-antitoxin system HicB family antitoxin [Oscillospiraceae bacterium]